MFKYFTLFILLCSSISALAQDPVLGGGRGRPNIGGITDRFKSSGGGSNSGTLDSLKKRNKLDDSITISFRFMKDAVRYKLDSSINDYIRFPIPSNYIFLGNTGAPAKPVLFSPILKAGFDEGKHALDVYKWNIDKIKSYKTTRPYTELAYAIGSKAEQLLGLTHTQNIRPDWNAAFDYRLISAPGYFRNQKNNHDNMVVNSHYMHKNKRYQNWFIYLANSFKQADYGGVRNPADLNNPIFKQRTTVETNLYNSSEAYGNPFSNTLKSGQQEKERILYLKQSYDFGKKDSIVINDSTTQYLFYSKFRVEHTITRKKLLYAYYGLQADSNFYRFYYSTTDTLFKKFGNWKLEDSWQLLENELSFYSFPDTKNNLQFIKAGIGVENWNGTIIKTSQPLATKKFANSYTHFAYKNVTKNKKWDLDVFAKLYLSGNNSGDYEINASLIRLTNSKLGNIRFAFQNVNRNPSFVYSNESAFGKYNSFVSSAKENHVQLTAQVFNEKKQQNIAAQLLQSTNLLTWQNFTTYKREAFFNMLKLSFERAFKVYKKIVWRTNVEAQQVLVGNPNINYARLYTRQRIAYEGNLKKKNLRIATGIEVRYIAPYKIDAWSPLTSQFAFQDSISSGKNLPDVHAYLHFNITSFNGFIRIENLNTVRYTTRSANNGLSFTNQNLVAVRYPNAGMVFRLGVYWRFVG